MNKLPEGPICFDCGIKLGGIAPDHAVTCSECLCTHCKEIKACPSVYDFDWPKLGVKRIWD